MSSEVQSFSGLPTGSGLTDTELRATAVPISLPSGNLIQNSSAGGTQKLTITDTVAQGSSQACKSRVATWSGTGPVTVNIGSAADADSFPLIAGMSLPYENLNLLYFYSATNGDIINLLWRN